MIKDGLGFLLAFFFFFFIFFFFKKWNNFGTTSGTKVYAIAYT